MTSYRAVQHPSDDPTLAEAAGLAREHVLNDPSALPGPQAGTHVDVPLGGWDRVAAVREGR